MDGVTILTTYETNMMLSGYEYLIIMCTMVCIFVLAALLKPKPGSDIEEVIATLSMIVSFVIAFVATLIFVCAFHVEHKIAVDDTVNFNELTSRYQIISQDGKLFTVKELAENNE
jgi:hypothetical protein